MKKSITIAAILITVIGAAFASGSETKKTNKAEQVKVFETNDDVFKLIYPFKEENTIQIAIKDSKGRTLLEEEVQNTEGFTKSYDLSGLKDGAYTLTILDSDEKIEKLMNVADDTSLALLETNSKEYKLIADFKTKSDMYVNIYNQDLELVHYEKIDNVSGFTRNYNLSNIEGEEFTFEVKSWTNSKKVATK